MSVRAVVPPAAAGPRSEPGDLSAPEERSAPGSQPGAAPVRTAIVGLGWAGRSIWLPRLRAHPRFTVAAAVDLDSEVRASLGADAAGVQLLDDPSLLRPEEIDLAVVAVPNHLHAPVAARLLAAGVPVFLEKPVCLSSTEADELAAAEQAGGAVLLAGSAARHRADVRALYAVAESCGELRHVELSWVRARGIPDAGGWFTDLRRAGGGALLDLGWHLLDVVAPLLGTAAFAQVLGSVSADFVGGPAGSLPTGQGEWGAGWRHPGQEAREHGPRPSSRVLDVEDTARGFLVTDGGVSISLRASWASHEALDSTVVRVEGSAGTATLTCTFGFSPNRRGGSVLTRTRDGASTDIPVPAEPVGAEYLRQLDELPGLLADPTSRGRAVAEARRAVGAIERFYRSARELPAPAVPVVSAVPALAGESEESGGAVAAGWTGSGSS